MSNPTKIGLAHAIRSLKAELSDAIRLAKKDEIKFRLGEVELELALAITWQGGVEGKVSFDVLGLVEGEAGAGGDVSRGNTHRIKLTLHPDPSGQPIQVTDTVSGRPED